MRFMIIVKASQNSEAGVMPKEELIAAMAGYHEELAKAGALLDASGLQPSSKGFRVSYAGAKRTIIDGPFAETKELVAGFMLWQVRSKEEAIEWVKRAPFQDSQEVELRPIFEMEDFCADFAPEEREQYRDRVLNPAEELLRAHGAEKTKR